MMTTPMTAADKDALIATAAEAGIMITRTSKDFFLGEGHNRERVTPGQIRALITEAQADRQARTEALAAADEIRAAEMASEGEAVQPEGEQVPEIEVAPVVQDAEPVAEPVIETIPAEPVAEAVSEMAAEAPAKAKVRYGPPHGGAVEHLPMALSEHGGNPIVHLLVPVTTRHKSKEAAAAAGRLSKAPGHLAFLAQDTAGARFWAVAEVLTPGGNLTLDGAEITLTLLEGQAAEDARAKLNGARWKAKAQWQATAV